VFLVQTCCAQRAMVLLWHEQVRAVGVSNYNAGQVEEMHGLLAKHGIPLASNQA
jgi:diketogulonate reductase-like aldo/keto reductase